MKKLFAIILALLMLTAIAVPAFSADVTPGVVTIPVNVTVTGNNTNPAYEFQFTLAAKDGAPMGDLATSYKANVAADTASAEFSIDFTTVTYPAPGTYTYTLTETTPVAPFAFKAGETGTREIVVYVENQGDELVIASAFMHKNADDAQKSEGFENEYKYNTYDLTLTKTVTGNQAEPGAEFEFTIVLTDVADGEYNMSNGETITVENGTGSATVTLKDGDELTIADLPEGYSYTITETANDYDTTIDNDGAAVEGKVATGEKKAKDVTVAYTNDKTGEIPTGVLLTIAPFAALMLIGAAGVLFVTLKKRVK